MTDKIDNTVPKDSADLSLEQRTRIERDKQNEIRVGITNRHLHLRTEECALDRRV